VASFSADNIVCLIDSRDAKDLQPVEGAGIEGA